MIFQLNLHFFYFISMFAGYIFHIYFCHVFKIFFFNFFVPLVLTIIQILLLLFFSLSSHFIFVDLLNYSISNLRAVEGQK